MQKVEGSSPFIRFAKAPLRRGFRLPERRQSIEMPADLPGASRGALRVVTRTLQR